MTSADASRTLVEAFAAAGQGQVFRFFDRLDGEGKARLLAQAATVDLEEVNRLAAEHLGEDGPPGLDLDGLEPAPYDPLPARGGDFARWEEAIAAGAEAISAGRVAAFTVAGGQGTRLGYDGPKGTFPITPVTGKTLFNVFADKIARSGDRFGQPLHWFILTSEMNNAATVAAFEAANFYGLDAGHVHFIVQGLIPAVDREGRILLSAPDRIAMAPDGHGGSLRALVRGGAVGLMKEKGIDCLSYFQVDNPIVQCIDPAFIGFHLLGDSELSSKMVPKADAEEKVGHFCVRQGRNLVIEYSDMPRELQERREPGGELSFRAGSVAIHIFDRDFIGRVGGNGKEGARLPFHRAEKKIPTVDEDGKPVEPDEPNGVKFEMFVFDALPLARNPVIIEADRAADFSPVKNAEGRDSPRTCKEDQLRLFTRWLRSVGVKLETDETGLPQFEFEISHRFAADEADFIVRWGELPRKPEIGPGVIIG